MALKKSYFRIGMWHSRPHRDPPPFMANTILNFYFDYQNPSLSTRHGFDKDRWVRIEEILAHGNFRPSPLRGWRVPVTDQFFRTSGYALHITSRHLKPKIIQSTFFCTTVYEKDYSSIFHFIGKYLALAIWHPFLCPPLRAPPQKSKLRYESSTLILYKELSSPIFPICKLRNFFAMRIVVDC